MDKFDPNSSLSKKAAYNLAQFEKALSTLQEVIELQEINQIVKDATIQ